MKILETLLNDVDFFYEKLERNEKAFKERSSQEASCRELSGNLESILSEDPVDLSALKFNLETAKFNAFSGLISDELISRAESALKEAATMLSTISTLLQTYTEQRTKANELALNQALETARRFRNAEPYLEAREYVLLHSAEEDLQITEANLETVTPAITSKAYAVMDFAYVRKSVSGVRWLARLESEFTEAAIPRGFEHSISSMITAQKSVNIKCAQDLIPGLTRVSSALECIDESVDNKTVVMTILFLLRSILSEIQTCSSIKEVLEFSLLLRAAYATLGKGLRKVYESLLLSFIHKFDRHSVPNFGEASSDPERRVLVLYASLIESGEMESFSVRNGWAWILRASKQLYVFQKNSEQDAVSECCVSILTFLQYCGGHLISHFGRKLISVLEKLSAVLVDHDKNPKSIQLREFIESTILAKKTYCSVTLLNIPTHVLSAYIFMRYRIYQHILCQF